MSATCEMKSTCEMKMKYYQYFYHGPENPDHDSEHNKDMHFYFVMAARGTHNPTMARHL